VGARQLFLSSQRSGQILGLVVESRLHFIGSLRWHLQHGRSAIPKSTNPTRIAENFDVFDFELSDAELERIARLDTSYSRATAACERPSRTQGSNHHTSFGHPSASSPDLQTVSDVSRHTVSYVATDPVPMS
jgi:hypothetical protein